MLVFFAVGDFFSVSMQFINPPVKEFLWQFFTQHTIYSKIYKKKYREGCIVEPAKYYCERDDVKF